jgi:predicted DNA-binding WGR domain protein
LIPGIPILRDYGKYTIIPTVCHPIGGGALSLFFPKVLVRRWGRIGTRRARSIKLVLGDAEAVREQVAQVGRLRLRHGYGLVAEVRAEGREAEAA